MTSPLLFAELCCGMAAVSLALFGGVPPVSRMGAKTGYAKTILRVLGIRPGSGASMVLLNDPDQDIARLWATLLAPGGRERVAEHIRSWIACPSPPRYPGAPTGSGCPGCDRCSHKPGRWDARDLWDTLKAEPKQGAEEVARWLYLAGSAYRQGVPDSGFAGTPGPGGPPCSVCGLPHSGRFGDVRDRCLGKLERLPTVPGLVSNLKAEELDPREVARWLYVFGNSYGGAFIEGYGRPGKDSGCSISRQGIDKRLSKLPSFPAAVSNLPAEEYPPLGFEGRRVLYLDPPYLNTTGYKHKFSRESLIDVARKWDEAGWEVVISEAEPIAALEWYSVDIGNERTGQKRTFSKQQSEHLTMNRAPNWKPSIQGRLF